MPPLSRLAIRLSLLHLTCGFLLGILIFAGRCWPDFAASGILLPIHIEMLLSGFMLQMVMGVAYWILPRFGNRRRRPGAASAAVLLVNFQVAVFAAGILYSSAHLLGVARRLLVAVILLFALHAWPRIRGYVRHGSAAAE